VSKGWQLYAQHILGTIEKLYPLNGEWHPLRPIDNTISPTVGHDSQSVMLKVSAQI